MEDEIKQKVFQQVLDLWVKPEIERRLNYKKINEGTIISKIQIVFSLESNKPQVRLNDEVKAVIKCKINTAKNKGEAVYESEVDKIENIELSNKDINCGHITLLLFKNHWVISFDIKNLIKNNGKTLELLKKEAKQNNFQIKLNLKLFE